MLNNNQPPSDGMLHLPPQFNFPDEPISNQKNHTTTVFYTEIIYPTEIIGADR